MSNGSLFPEEEVILEVIINRSILLRNLSRTSREVQRLERCYSGNKNKCQRRLSMILDDVGSVRKEKYLNSIDEKLSYFRVINNHVANKNKILARSFLLCKEKQIKFQRSVNGLARKYGRILNFNIYSTRKNVSEKV